MTLTKQAVRLRDQYLKRVKHAVRWRDKAERESVLAGVREHLDEALARVGLETIDESVMQSVLASLAPPESFAGEGAPSPKYERSKRWAVVSIACLGGALGGLLVVLAASNWYFGEWMPAVLSALTLLSLLSAVAALVFGLLGFAHPLGKTSVFALLGMTILLAAYLIPVGRVVTSTSEFAPSVDPFSQQFEPFENDERH